MREQLFTSHHQHEQTHILCKEHGTNMSKKQKTLTSETPVCGCTAVPLQGPEHLPPQWHCSGSWWVVWEIEQLQQLWVRLTYCRIAVWLNWNVWQYHPLNWHKDLVHFQSLCQELRTFRADVVVPETKSQECGQIYSNGKSQQKPYVAIYRIC